MINAFSQLFGLLDIILLMIIYFTRNIYKSEENRIYGFLIIMSFIGQLLHISSYITIYNMEVMPLINKIVTKSYLVYLAIWVSAFFLYICAATYKILNKRNYLKELKEVSRLLLLFDIIVITLITILPTYCYVNGNIVYTHGASVNLIYMVSILYILISLTIFIYYYKEIKKVGLKKYIPLFIFMSVGVVVMIVQYMNPSLLLITSCETFITLLMYFTIENPDLKILNEFHKTREYAENSNNEKTAFLFNISSQVKEPANKINSLSKELLMSDDIDEIKLGLSKIKYSSNNLLEVINNVLDISDSERRNISIREKLYTPYNLFKSIESSTHLKLKEKDLEFKISYDKTIPSKLYGDSIRVKQIITTLLDNSIKYTSDGFIELSVNSVIKHDICRLIIAVEDSGAGISSDKIPTLFDKHKLYDDESLKNIDDTKMNLGMVKSLVDLIGGVIMVNSELGKWTKFTVIIDQKMPETTKSEVLKEIEKYDELYKNKKSLLLVLKDKKLQKQFLKKLRDYDINIDIVSNGEDCIKKVRNKNNYKLIMMEDGLEKLSCIDVYNKLKLFSPIPVVLFLRNANISVIKEYESKGFLEVEVLPLKEDQIETIMEKYNLDN